VADNIGIAFQPGSQRNDSNGADAGNRTATVPVQEAVRLLSLRLPSVVGARALAPGTLLRSPGSAGLTGPGGMNVDAMIEWLRRQMQQSGASVPSQAEGIFGSPQPASLQPSGSQPRVDTPTQAPAPEPTFAPPPPRVVPAVRPAEPSAPPVQAPEEPAPAADFSPQHVDPYERPAIGQDFWRQGDDYWRG
jgi:hypothetical protein